MILKKVVDLIDSFSRFVGKTVSYIMILVVAVVIYEVSMRYIFVRPTIWASEAIVFCCGIVYVLGASWTLLEKRHVKIDILWCKFSPRTKRIVDSITFFFFALYIGLMIWEGSKFALESINLAETTGTPWDPPVYPIKIIFVTGMVMLFMQGISKLLKDLYFIVKGKEL